MKYRILYQVAAPLRCKTEKSARKELDSISDDVGEFAMAALNECPDVIAKLQVELPDGWHNVAALSERAGYLM